MRFSVPDAKCQPPIKARACIKRKNSRLGLKVAEQSRLLSFIFLSFFFLDIYYVPGCSGMFRVPGFIDAQKLCINDLRVLHIKDMNA